MSTSPHFGGPGEIAAVERVTRAEELARHLESEIVEGRLAPGDRIGTKEDLRRRSGFAMATVNEAIRLLENRGLVTARSGPGGGVFACSPSTRVRFKSLVLGFTADYRPFADSLAVRNQLEPLIIRTAFSGCRPEDASDLREVVSGMDGAVDDLAEFVALDWALHRRLAEIGDNATLARIYLTLMDLIEDGLADVSRADSFDGPRLVALHRELAEAVIDSDAARLQRAVDAHCSISDDWAVTVG